MSSFDEIMDKLTRIERRLDLLQEDVRRNAETVSRIALKINADKSTQPALGEKIEPN